MENIKKTRTKVNINSMANPCSSSSIGFIVTTAKGFLSDFGVLPYAIEEPIIAKTEMVKRWFNERQSYFVRSIQS